MGGAPSAPSAQTVTNQPPQYVQNQAEQNMGVANYLAAQPFPNYQGQLIAPLNTLQNQGIAAANNAAYSADPALSQAASTIGTAVGSNPVNAANTAATSPFSSNLVLSNNNISQYMNPYVQQSLNPQIQQAQQQLANEQLATNAQATQANAFGDARQGVQNSLNQYYGNQNLANIEATGYNQAYNTALGTAQNQQNLGLQEQGVQQQQQNLGLNEQNLLLGAGQQEANLGQTIQQTGITGANALADAGQLQQQNQQQQLNTAYEQYLNQTQWPYQQLAVQESAISNNPYSLTNNINLPQAGTIGSGLGAFTNLAGSLGSLFGGSGSGATSPFG